MPNKFDAGMQDKYRRRVVRDTSLPVLDHFQPTKRQNNIPYRDLINHTNGRRAIEARVFSGPDVSAIQQVGDMRNTSDPLAAREHNLPGAVREDQMIQNAIDATNERYSDQGVPRRAQMPPPSAAKGLIRRTSQPLPSGYANWANKLGRFGKMGLMSLFSPAGIVEGAVLDRVAPGAMDGIGAMTGDAQARQRLIEQWQAANQI